MQHADQGESSGLAPGVDTRVLWRRQVRLASTPRKLLQREASLRVDAIVATTQFRGW